MKLTKGQLTGAFAVAIAGLGTLFANYKPDIDHEPVKLSARAEAEARADALHHQPLSLLRMAGGGDTEETTIPAPVPETTSPNFDSGLESIALLNAFGGTLMKEALSSKLPPTERLLMMLEATNLDSLKDIAESMGTTPDELARVIRATAMQDIETLQKEIAVNPDDPLGNIIQLVAIRNGLSLAGIQPDGKILKTYGEQMAGITDAEVHATIQSLQTKALPAAVKEAEFNVTLDVKQMTPQGLIRMITVADLVTSAHRASVANQAGNGSGLVTPADAFAKKMQAQITDAKQEQFNRYETIVVKKLQQQVPSTAMPRVDTQSPFAPPKKEG